MNDHGRGAGVAFFVASALAHAGVFALGARLRPAAARVERALAPVEVIDAQPPRVSPPPVPAAQPSVPPRPSAMRRAPQRTHPVGPALAALPASAFAEPVDLTGSMIVTSRSGTEGGASVASDAAESAPPSVEPAAVDRTRAAALGDDTEWHCPFPQEADSAQIDDAYVSLRVNVRADGSPSSVRVLDHPGHGFDREAARCALQRRYTSALDPDGRPIAGTTHTIRVHFAR